MSPARERLLFLQEFLAHPADIGALFPSGIALAKAMSEPLSAGQVTLEIGAGTGSLTGKLLERIRNPSCLTSVEMNPVLAAQFRSAFPSVPLEMRDAEGVLREGTGWDAIVSGIPFVLMGAEKRKRMFDLVVHRLNPGGVFVAFQYSLSSKSELQRHFQNIAIKFAPLNFPPAVVYVCREPIL